MKVTARVLVDDKKVALDCRPFLRAPYTVYATFIVDLGWTLSSGREPSKDMLDAIDRLPGITLRSRAK